MVDGSARPVNEVARALGTHPTFGDSRRIQQRAAAYYELTMAMLARRVPEVAGFAAALRSVDEAGRDAVLWHPAVRLAMHDQLVDEAQRSPLAARSQEVLALAVQRFEHASMPRFVDRLWIGGRDPQLWASYLTSAFERWIAPSLACEVDLGISAPQADAIEAAHRVLAELWPELDADLFCHTNAIVCMVPRDPAAPALPPISLSDPRIPATIFLSPAALEGGWSLAADLLHEAVHHHFYDLCLARAVFSTSQLEGRLPHDTVRTYWHPGSAQQWSIRRALSALVVYVHLAAFDRLAQLRPASPPAAWGRYRGDDFTRHAAERARFLGSRLQQQATDALHRDGAALLAWLLSQLDALERG